MRLYPERSGDRATPRFDPRIVHVGSVGYLRILLVDNELPVLDSMKVVLELDGHRVSGANGGQAGIDMFIAALSGAEPFDAVITDLAMPGVDGRQLAHAVKSISPTTAVILLTGWGAQSQDPAGVDCVLGKPPRLNELRAALAKGTTAAGRAKG